MSTVAGLPFSTTTFPPTMTASTLPPSSTWTIWSNGSFRGIQLIRPRSRKTTSALYPGARRPSPSRPSARAPPTVAAWNASAAERPASRSRPCAVETSAARRVASYMF